MLDSEEVCEDAEARLCSEMLGRAGKVFLGSEGEGVNTSVVMESFLLELEGSFVSFLES